MNILKDYSLITKSAAIPATAIETPAKATMLIAVPPKAESKTPPNKPAAICGIVMVALKFPCKLLSVLLEV